MCMVRAERGARARATRWRRPLDKVPHASRARPARPTARRAPSMRSFGSGASHRSAKHSRFSATLSRRYRPGDSGMIAIRRGISTPFSGVSGIPATVAEPEADAISVPSVRTVVVFPGTVRPEEPEHLAAADLEGPRQPLGCARRSAWIFRVCRASAASTSRVASLHRGYLHAVSAALSVDSGQRQAGRGARAR